MQEKKITHKGVYILPNLFTLASLFLAFIGMIQVIGNKFHTCALIILGSAVLDGLDGKIARLTNTSSEFGVQLDSLVDLVAFGVTPAFLAWKFGLEQFGKLGICISFLFIACTALRLARFNISTSILCKKFFVGLPCPTGGCSLGLFILFTPYLPNFFNKILPHILLTLTFILSLLMVSRIRYFSFKEYGFLKTHTFSSMVTALLLFVLLLSEPAVMGFILCIIYLLSGPIYTYIFLPKRSYPLGKVDLL